MGRGDYFKYVRDSGKVTGYIDGLLSQGSVFMDTNVVPSLKPYILKGYSHPKVVGMYTAFMDSFIGWLKESENLVIVPKVGLEMSLRLQSARGTLRRKWKRGTPKQLSRYDEQLDEAIPLLDKDLFVEQPGCVELLHLLSKMHSYMQWQKREHKAGNADDQLAAAAIVYATNGKEDVCVMSCDDELLQTLNSFYRFVTSRQVARNGIFEIVNELRQARVSGHSFDLKTGEYALHSTTNGGPDFNFRYWDYMRRFDGNGRPARFQQAKSNMLTLARQVLNAYGAKLQDSRDKQVRAMQREQNILDAVGMDSIDQLVGSFPQVLEQLAPTEPEGIPDARQQYAALRRLMVETEHFELIRGVDKMQRQLEVMDGIVNQIREVRAEFDQASKGSKNLEDARAAEGTAKRLATLYSRLETEGKQRGIPIHLRHDDWLIR